MRLLDTNAPTELDYFWMALGALQTEAWLAGRQNEDIHMEVGANVVEELQKQGAGEAGKWRYCMGMSLGLEVALNGLGMKNKPDERAAVREALLGTIGAVQLIKVTVTQEKRSVEKTTVIEHDTDGRIRTFVKEQVQI